MRQGAPVWRCGRRKRPGVESKRHGRICRRAPGGGTAHPGWGACSRHTTPDEDWMWIMALGVAEEENITPWDALLVSVKRAAGRVKWVDAMLDETVRKTDGDANNPAVRAWLDESRRERTLLAKMAKAAIDAGIAERYVRQVELEGQLVAAAVVRAIDALELTSEQRVLALEAAQAELLGSGIDQTTTVMGTVLHDDNPAGRNRPTTPPADLEKNLEKDSSPNEDAEEDPDDVE